MTRTQLLWTLWIIGTLALAGVAGARIFVTGDRTAFLPGQTTGVHHQLEIACETCHTSKPFASTTKVRKDINKTCVTCHKDELKAADDSHPKKKFTPPRMAQFWDKVDGRFCTTCHSEHLPEVTLAGMVTIQGDYCVACHSEGEQDVRVNRASHADLTFDTCASSGCHNYHDNRALYEDFLVKHADSPWIAEDPVHAASAAARQRPKPDADAIRSYLAALPPAPELHPEDEAIAHDWAGSAHAAADVSCASCHAPKSETAEEIAADWVESPDPQEICSSCHKAEAKTFRLGRHGTRAHPKLGKPRNAKHITKDVGWKADKELLAQLDAYLNDATPPPLMSTAEARVPLHAEAMGQELTCTTCHGPHKVDVVKAQVESCTSCHADDHSMAYEGSPHHQLWQAELAGDLPPGSGVTCATCHMPKEETSKGVVSNHNQNDTLRPNEKMIRPICMDCHGLRFAIDALADPDLVANNFAGQPSRTIESVDWAVRRVDQPDEGSNQ